MNINKKNNHCLFSILNKCINVFLLYMIDNAFSSPEDVASCAAIVINLNTFSFFSGLKLESCFTLKATT